jgi:hypothetical protein
VLVKAGHLMSFEPVDESVHEVKVGKVGVVELNNGIMEL